MAYLSLMISDVCFKEHGHGDREGRQGDSKASLVIAYESLSEYFSAKGQSCQGVYVGLGTIR